MQIDYYKPFNGGIKMKKMFSLLAVLTLCFICFQTAQAATVTLQWNSVATAEGYKLYHGTDSRTYDAPDDTGNNTTFTLQLNPGIYYFAVTAYNCYGESGYSVEVGPIAILAPTVNLTVRYSGTEVALNWDEISGATGYRVLCGIASGEYGDGIDVGLVMSTILVLQPGTHYFIIDAYNDEGVISRRAEEVVVPIAGSPKELTVTVEE